MELEVVSSFYQGTGGHVIIIRSFHLLILIFSDKFDVRSVIG